MNSQSTSGDSDRVSAPSATTATPKTASSVEAAPARPDYRLQFEPCQRRIRVDCAGVTIADSDRVIILREPRYQPVCYFPRQDVRMDLLEATDHVTHCPFKGNASYWSLCLEGHRQDNIAWSYLQPQPEAEAIAGYIAFYRDRMQDWSEDSAEVFTHSLHQPTGHVNSLINWLLWEAWDAATPEELVTRLVQQLNELGAQLIHLNVVIPTLHPLLAARAYRWKRAEGRVESFGASHETLSTSAFQDSPLVPVLDGHGGIRQRIDPEPAQTSYPIIEDLRQQGGTDYLALPMSFSDGQINVITFATDRAEGFSLELQAEIHEILPLLARLFEVHAMKHTATELLQTFIGRHTGAQVLKGAIRRGDGEDIHAVIWFSDLRGSTELAERMPRQQFLDYLNRYFDCIAGAIAEHGGEVLRFVGDAVLAIFPIASRATGDRDTFINSREACEAAIQAVGAARLCIEEASSELERLHGEPIRSGIGLHLGDVTYGNIGTEDRLEFTVIGQAANEAARIETMTRLVGCPVVLSSAFAEAAGSHFRSLGDHQLRGVGRRQQLFTLWEPEAAVGSGPQVGPG